MTPLVSNSNAVEHGRMVSIDTIRCMEVKWKIEKKKFHSTIRPPFHTKGVILGWPSGSEVFALDCACLIVLQNLPQSISYSVGIALKPLVLYKQEY